MSGASNGSDCSQSDAEHCRGDADLFRCVRDLSLGKGL